MGRRLRHRPGGMDLRSGHLSITGAMGPSTSWDPWPRPVARAAVGTQECTQIGENDLSAQPPLACRTRLSVTSRWHRWCRMRFSVTSRRPGGVGQPPARLRGTMENASTGQMRSSNPPPACGAGCARVRRSRFGVRPHGKAHSVPGGSRKDALSLTPSSKPTV